MCLAGQDRVPVTIDYEGSQYRAEFWEGQGREYENAAERIALRHLLPRTSRRMVELGAGFGRLADLYAPYEQVVLLDYSRSLLEDAQQRWGHDPRFVFVVGNIYDLPFADSAFDTTVMVRVLHHLVEPQRALHEMRRILTGGGELILEYANKRNLKAILRYLLQRRGANPFSLEPWEFVPLNFDFHPRHVEGLLGEIGFVLHQRRSVSILRLPALKRLLPASLLARLDGFLQVPTAPLRLGPSIFVRVTVPGERGELTPSLFRCPSCHAVGLQEDGGVVWCAACGQHWSRRDGIYDFKNPLTR